MTDDRHLTDEEFQDYLEHETDLAHQAELEAHIGSCPSCAGRLERWRGLFSAIGGLPDSRLPEDLVPLVLRRLEESAARSRALRWVLAAEATVVIALTATRFPELALAVESAAFKLGGADLFGLRDHLVFLTARTMLWVRSVIGDFASLLEFRRVLPVLGVPGLGWMAILLAAAIAWGAGSFVLLRGAQAIDQKPREGNANR